MSVRYTSRCFSNTPQSKDKRVNCLILGRKETGREPVNSDKNTSPHVCDSTESFAIYDDDFCYSATAFGSLLFNMDQHWVKEVCLFQNSNMVVQETLREADQQRTYFAQTSMKSFGRKVWKRPAQVVDIWLTSSKYIGRILKAECLLSNQKRAHVNTLDNYRYVMTIRRFQTRAWTIVLNIKLYVLHIFVAVLSSIFWSTDLSRCIVFVYVYSSGSLP